MGNGQTRPGDQAVSTTAQTTDHTQAQTSLSEQQWRINLPADRQGLGMTQAQATGIEGTYGAPSMPAARATTEQLQPKSANIGSPKFVYNPESAPAVPIASTNTGFKPVDYNVDQKSGGYPGTLLPAEVSTFLGPAVVGVPGTIKRWAPELDKKFSWVEPAYTAEKHVSAATELTFNRAQKRAVPFLRSLKDAYNSDPALQAAEALAPAARTTAEEQLVERAQIARSAWNQTKMAAAGNNPISPIDFRDLASDPKVHAPSAASGWRAVQDFEHAQTSLITERAANLTAVQRAERGLYDAEIKAAKNARLKDFGALGAATVINFAVDQVAPKDDPSWLSVAADYAAPAIMFAELSGLGKWEPVVKGGVIVGTHLLTHFLLDRNIEDEQKK
jgi:hypothetical protein